MTSKFRKLTAVRGVRSLLLLLTALFAATDGGAEETPRRIALVVGNQTYESVVQLDNPISDAQLVASKLENKGFVVSLLMDAGQAELNSAIRDFGSDLRSSGKDTVGLFYYAGHAVQSFGSNFLLPVDISLKDPADLSLVAVRADAILRQMSSAQNRTNILILDACRNNPFSDLPDMNDNGLAEMKAPTGSFMAYSTAPDSVALDGTDGNSPFTAALAAEMDTVGLPIEQLFKQVRSRVLEKTNGRQTPWDSSSLTQEFFFSPAVPKSPEELAQQRFFESLQQTQDPVQMVVFLRNYPDSEYSGDVRKMLTAVLDGESEIVPSALPADKEPGVAPSSQTQSQSQKTPKPAEKELIDVAQASGSIADYEAYLEAYPEGVYAELARMEISAKVAKDPAAPPGGLRESAAATPAATLPPVSVDRAGDDSTTALVSFEAPLTEGSADIVGKSIEILITGSPLFPPIQGLPEEVWKGKKCSNCHQWTRKALCDQANTYLGSGVRALNKEHPYGGTFKRNLKNWAVGGCR